MSTCSPPTPAPAERGPASGQGLAAADESRAQPGWLADLCCHHLCMTGEATPQWCVEGPGNPVSPLWPRGRWHPQVSSAHRASCSPWERPREAWTGLVTVPGLFPWLECDEECRPPPSPQACFASPRQQAGSPRHPRGLLCVPHPRTFPAVGLHMCLLVPGCEGSWDVPTQAIFTQPCPHRALLRL